VELTVSAHRGHLGTGKLIAAALIGGAVASAVAYLFSIAFPWLFRTTGIFPYTVAELVVNDVTHIAAGSFVLAIPISLLLGVPILFVAFRWAPLPVAMATVLGGSVGPIVLAVLLRRAEALPYGSTAVLLCVALFGVLGAFASAWFLNSGNRAARRKSAA
jgi:hypothetical protein